jgi:hypothetical protein
MSNWKNGCVAIQGNLYEDGSSKKRQGHYAAHTRTLKIKDIEAHGITISKKRIGGIVRFCVQDDKEYLRILNLARDKEIPLQIGGYTYYPAPFLWIEEMDREEMDTNSA